MVRSWDRSHWRNKREINRLLHLRSQEPANQGICWNHCSDMFNSKGAIYAIYHFTSGRWYVGQTIDAIYKRAQGHWWARFQASDAFHQALGLDLTPFSFIALPLEWISPENFQGPDVERLLQIKEFRRAATPRERYWVDRLNSMWPHGWNSAVPGRPVAAHVLRRYQQNPMAAEEQRKNNTLQAADWVSHWKDNPEEAIRLAVQQTKETIRDTIHHLQARHNPADLIVNGQSPVPLLLEELRRRRCEPPNRQFLRMKFTSNAARDLQIRAVLRDATVYHKHPEPEIAAAIMVSESFDPQIQGLLFNYTQAAIDLKPEQALTDDLSHCLCRNSFTKINPLDLGPSGHVCTFDTANLKWGYLSTLTIRGKKFRIPASSDTVAKELDRALHDYVAWASKRGPDACRVKKLEEWATAVRELAMRNWNTAQAKKPLGTLDGFPGLKQTIKEAREHLVFLHDDRAPHGLFLVCKRWYQREMAQYLTDTEVFEEVGRPWDDVVADITKQVEDLGFKVGQGIPYNYGIWKARRTSSAS